MIKLKTMIEVETNVHTVSVNVKVSDRGSYVFKDDTGKVIKDFTENYVPDFFPGEHYGDYLELEIDIETGVILNWKKPTADELDSLFNDE